MEKMELSEALKANASVLEELVFKYTLISLLSELDGLLWNNTSPGSIYSFNSTSDYDSKKASVWSSRNSRGQTFWRQFHYSNSL